MFPGFARVAWGWYNIASVGFGLGFGGFGVFSTGCLLLVVSLRFGFGGFSDLIVLDLVDLLAFWVCSICVAVII